MKMLTIQVVNNRARSTDYTPKRSERFKGGTYALVDLCSADRLGG